MTETGFYKATIHTNIPKTPLDKNIRILHIDANNTLLERIRTNNTQAYLQAPNQQAIQRYAKNNNVEIHNTQKITSVAAIISGSAYIPKDIHYDIQSELNNQFRGYALQAQKTDTTVAHLINTKEELHTPRWFIPKHPHNITTFDLAIQGRPDTVFNIANQAMSLYKHFPIQKKSLVQTIHQANQSFE